MKKNSMKIRFTKNIMTFVVCVLTQSTVASSNYLTTIAASPFNTGGSGPYFGTYSPDNKFFAAANSSSSITIFEVNAISGQLTPISGSPFSSSNSYLVTYSPIIEGKYYLAASSTNTIIIYSVDSTSGTITEINSYPTGNDPESIVYSPNGKWLAAANYSSDSITIYSVNQSSGILTAVPGSPFTSSDIPQLDGPYSVSYSPDNKYLAMINYNNGKIIVCSVNQNTGALENPQSPVITGNSSDGNFLTYSSDGKWLAATTYEALIYVFKVNANGSLTAVTGAPFETNGNAYILSYSPDSTHLAVTCSDGIVRAYCVNTDGALTKVMAVGAGNYPWSVAYSPNNLWLGVVNEDAHDVYAFDVAYTDNATAFVKQLQLKYGPLL